MVDVAVTFNRRTLDFIISTGGYRLSDLCEKMTMDSGYSAKAGTILMISGGDPERVEPQTGLNAGIGVLMEDVNTADGAASVLVLRRYAILNGGKLVTTFSDPITAALENTSLIVRAVPTVAAQ